MSYSGQTSVQYCQIADNIEPISDHCMTY